jgi:hypothetical protein
MSLTTKVGFLAGATATTIAGAAFAGTSANVSYEDLQQRLDAAEAKIAELSTTQNADWLTEQRADDIRGLVQDVLADADTRASLQGSGMQAGYNNGFVISSNDGQWMLRINGLLQNRWILSHTKNDTTAGAAALLGGAGEKSHHGFETTRAALNFSGTVAKDYHFNMRLNWSPYMASNTPGPANLEWAYASVDLSDEVSLTMGKQKFDVMREYMVNAEFQQTIERSLSSYYWATSSVTNGIKLGYQNDSIRANVMYSNAPTFNAAAFGVNLNTGAYTMDVADWMLSGRVAWKASGTWEQFDEMTSPQGSEAGMLFGFGWWAGNVNDNVVPLPDPGTLWGLSIDASLDFGGWNLFGSFTYADDKVNGFGNVPDGHQYGWLIQGGFYLSEDLELFGRFEYLNPKDPVIANNNIEILTIGANWYLAGQNAKLSLDWGYNWDRTVTANNGASGYTGWINSNDKGEWVLRTQLQLYF